MILVFVFGAVCGLSLLVVVFSFRERLRLADEVNGVVAGIEQRTADEEDAPPTLEVPLSAELELLLDEAIQPDDHQLAVLAVNELTGRAGLARSRALLLSRGLPRIALLSGGGGAFVVAALGHFSKTSLMFALGSVLVGIFGAMTCHGLNAGCRRLAKRYIGILDVLARQVEQHFQRRSEGPRLSPP